MKKKVITGLVIIFILILVITLTFLNLPSKSSSQSNNNLMNIPNNSSFISNGTINSSQEIPTNPQITTINSETLAQHNSKSDCWIVYNDKVYDITSYLPRHPGGAGTITPFCGNLGFNSAFVDYHGTVYEKKLLSAAIYQGDFSG
jgi:cytochrome b involved in lipid metabolism